MSEYRKYRLISKFAEINGLHGVPQKYVAMISAESGSEHPHYEVHCPFLALIWRYRAVIPRMVECTPRVRTLW